jgi:multidrug efflux pump subunit AcrA (membrane-fusion protein)
VSGTIARRSPSADGDTRTVHVEVDLADPKRDMPVNTTGEVHIDVGEPQSGSAVPLDSASISGTKAVVFVVEGGLAHKATYKMLGERGGTLFVDESLKPGALVVTEGRAVLRDGDHVEAKTILYAPSASAVVPSGAGGHAP